MNFADMGLIRLGLIFIFKPDIGEVGTTSDHLVLWRLGTLSKWRYIPEVDLV